MNEDYALERVPADRTVSGIRIAVVSIGIIIALPAFISGAEIGFSLGFRKGAFSVVFGGALLAAIAMATGTVGARTRLNTAMITKLTFGSAGGSFVSLILAVSCLGWFGVTAELFGRSIQQILAGYGLSGPPTSVYSMVGGGVMLATTLYGFYALQRLSNVTVPLLAVLILYTAYLTIRTSGSEVLSASGSAERGIGDGVSAIVGGLAIAVTIFPDLCRFARTGGDARLAAVLTFGIAMPVILLAAMIPSVATHQRDLILVMTAVGLGAPALVLLIVKAWTTNAGNLYSASLSAANVFPRVDQKWIIVAAGGLGTALAVAGITEEFIPFLILLGVCIPPVAGIYVVYFLVREHGGLDMSMIQDGPALRPLPFACWGLGIAVALAARFGLVTLTGISACDSMLTAAACYFAVMRLSPAVRATIR